MESFNALNNHYSETCEIQRSAIKERNKLFVILCLITGLLFLLIISKDETVFSLNNLLNEKWALNFTFSSTIMQSLCWIFFLYFSMRYIQSNVYIERQYDYIHKLEQTISKKGDFLFEREGKAYLYEYPFVSNYIDFIYKWVLPMVFLVTTIIKIVLEIVNDYNISIYFNILIALFNIVLWISYILFLKKKHN